MSLRDFSTKHPVLLTCFCIAVISFPQWFQSVWSLFRTDAPVPAIRDLLKDLSIAVPQFSPYWISVPLGIGMFLWLISELRKQPRAVQHTEVSRNVEQEISDDRGLLDYQVDALAGFETISQIAVGWTTRLNAITLETNTAAEQIQNPDESSDTKRATMRALAKSLKGHTNWLRDGNARYRQALANISGGLSAILSGEFKVEPDAQESLRLFLNQLEKVKEATERGRGSLLQLAETMDGLPRIEREFNLAKRGLSDELKILIGNVDQTSSILVRARKSGSRLLREGRPESASFPQKKEFVPIHRAIAHIAQLTDDSEHFDGFRATRELLRQYASDNKVQMRGRKQIDEPGPTKFSSVETDIPFNYWKKSVLNHLAPHLLNKDDHHTDPESVYAWGSQGIFERKRYAGIRIDWQAILREWPKQ